LVLLHLIPPGFPNQVQGFDTTVRVFVAGISIATGIVIGLLPALRSSQVRLAPSLREGSAQAGSGGQRLRAFLVVVEVATAVILLSGAALMIRSLEKLIRQDPGFTADRVLTLQTPLPQPKYSEAARRRGFYRDVLQLVQALPGVAAAGYSTFLPLASPAGGALVTIENHAVDPHHFPIANIRVVSPGYFHAIGMRLIRGRLTTGDDTPESLKIVVINETMARTYWPTEDPIGRRLKVAAANVQAPWVTVVGVVADIRQGGLDVPIRPEGYFPVDQFDPFAPTALAIRTSGDPSAIADAVRQQIWTVDREQPIVGVATLDQLVYDSALSARMQAALFTGFGALALVLAGLGIYAVLSFAVTERIREIGVRVALGAQPRDVLAMIVAQGLRLYVGGLAIGLAAALMLSRLIAHVLFGVTPTDPASYAAVVGTLLAVTLLACYVPARRAVRIDPLRALRWE
ncbi:MAG TPA: FtsX-like permease family protein, partial [Vicinamibacterales bacterium]